MTDRAKEQILSASEIGSFTVCAESWRLRRLARAERASASSRERGEKLHQTWADSFDLSFSLHSWSRLLLLLVLIGLVSLFLFSLRQG